MKKTSSYSSVSFNPRPGRSRRDSSLLEQHRLDSNLPEQSHPRASPQRVSRLLPEINLQRSPSLVPRLLRRGNLHLRFPSRLRIPRRNLPNSQSLLRPQTPRSFPTRTSKSAEAAPGVRWSSHRQPGKAARRISRSPFRTAIRVWRRLPSRFRSFLRSRPFSRPPEPFRRSQRHPEPNRQERFLPRVNRPRARCRRRSQPLISGRRAPRRKI